MNLKVLVFLPVFLFLTSSVFAQNDEIPIPVLPSKSITNNTSDTMWVLHSTKQFKEVSKALNTRKLYKKLLVKNKQLIDSLELLNTELSNYNDSLKNERNLYIEQIDECESDVALLGKMNENQSKYTRIAIIVGSSTTVIGFVVGFILGIK